MLTRPEIAVVTIYTQGVKISRGMHLTKVTQRGMTTTMMMMEGTIYLSYLFFHQNHRLRLVHRPTVILRRSFLVPFDLCQKNPKSYPFEFCYYDLLKPLLSGFLSPSEVFNIKLLKNCSYDSLLAKKNNFIKLFTLFMLTRFIVSNFEESEEYKFSGWFFKIQTNFQKSSCSRGSY